MVCVFGILEVRVIRGSHLGFGKVAVSVCELTNVSSLTIDPHNQSTPSPPYADMIVTALPSGPRKRLPKIHPTWQ
jgi:hypothetical protein